MQKLLLTLCLFTSFQFSSLFSMEKSVEHPHVQLIRRTASAEAIHSEEYTKLKAQKAFETKIAELNSIHAQLQSAPALPKQKAKIKPPMPEKPKSFIEQHKKALIWGGVGASTLAVTGIAWHLLKIKNLPITIDEFADNELA